MKPSALRFAAAVLVAGLALAADAAAAPILTISITPATVSGTPGSQVDVNYSITNESQSDYVLITGASSNPVPGFDPIGFLDTGGFEGFLALLAPNGGLTSGKLGTFTFDPAAVPGKYASYVVDIAFNYVVSNVVPPDQQAIDDAFGSDPIFEQGGFRAMVTDSAPVPEPATMTLVGLGLVGGALRRYRSRA